METTTNPPTDPPTTFSPDWERIYSAVLTLLKPPTWFSPHCFEVGKYPGDSSGYSLHFHTLGKLRWWKYSMWVINQTDTQLVELDIYQAAYILAYKPKTWSECLSWLHNAFPGKVTVHGMFD